jgi:hypothetical protein
MQNEMIPIETEVDEYKLISRLSGINNVTILIYIKPIL